MEQILLPTNKGVVVVSDDKQVVSAVDCKGQKKLISFKNSNKIVFWHFPFMRGVQYFFCGIVAFFQALLLCNDLCSPPVKIKDTNKFYLKKMIIFIAWVVVGFAFSAILVGLVPAKLSFLFVDYKGSGFLRNLCILAFKLFYFYILIFTLRLFPSVNELFRFNKAVDLIVLNNKTNQNIIKKNKDKGNINNKDKKGNIKNKSRQGYSLIKNFKAKVSKKTEFAPNFLNFVVFVFVLTIVVITLCGVGFGFWFNIAFHLAIFLLCISVGYELLAVVENFAFVRFFRCITSFLVFLKPTRTHYESVSVAVTEMNLLQKGRDFMNDESKRAFSVVYSEVKNKLASAGINDKSDADWLIATILGKSRTEVKFVVSVTEKQYQDIMKACERRAKGESLDNIFGYTEFFGLRFDVNKKVLTPRMETEILVENVLKVANEIKDCKILDIGTGSGAIAVSLAKNCDAKVVAVDVSKTALATAESNAKKNDVKIEFVWSNLFEGLKRKRKFDIIVSNPPYIPSKDISKLDKNVRECDPILALDGGEDGLDFYRAIIVKAPARLEKNGRIFFEVGKGQATAIKKLLKESGFEEIKSIKDYNKIERIVCGKYK